ncbi:hypothetical protein OSB04_025118 [Centaurea solstitialis]|uniref:Uncharacterized protein n=1 Tax=Centaurea solstitialis TaxID=347529 RepID=A0AA38SZ60_9ASTR|nr:hypothetical protein OSB04_025118 [Centaurea solstitialis]
MGDQWMNDNLVTYIEKEVFANVGNEDIIEMFQKMKTRWGVFKRIRIRSDIRIPENFRSENSDIRIFGYPKIGYPDFRIRIRILKMTFVSNISEFSDYPVSESGISDSDSDSKFQYPKFSDIRKSGYPKIRISENPDIRKSGYPKMNTPTIC